MNRKYLLLAIGGVGFLAVLGMFLYFGLGLGFQTGDATPTSSGLGVDLVSGGVPSDTASGNTSGNDSGIFPTDSSKPTALPGASASLDGVARFWRVPGTTRLFVVKTNGEIFIGEEDGELIKQEMVLGEGEPLLLSRDGLKVLARRTTEGGSTLVVLDLSKKKEYSLGKEETIHSPVFSHDSKTLYFQYRDAAKQIRYLASSGLDLKGIKQVFPLNFLDMNIVSLGKDKLLFVPTASGYVYGTVYEYSISGKRLKELFSGYGIQATPHEEGTRIFYSMTESGGRNLKLFSYDVLKGTSKELGLRTLASKCAARGVSLLCGVPTNFDTAHVHPDAYYKGAFTPHDDIILLNSDTQAVQKFVTLAPKQQVDIINPVLNSDSMEALFIDKASGQLYRLPL